MSIEIYRVPYDKKHVIRNLLEIYLYDMSEFDDDEDSLDLNEAGVYGYKYLDHYWTDEGRYPYIVTADGKIAGFSLIRTVETNPLTFEIAEFFILKKYRKLGMGKLLCSKLFCLHEGNWIINTPIKNQTAQHFWRNTVKHASEGIFTEYLIENGRRMEWTFNG